MPNEINIQEIPDRMIDVQERVVRFILNPTFEGVFLYIKIIFIIISSFFALTIIIFLLRNTWLKRFILEDITEVFTARPYGAKKGFKEWTKIQKRLETEKEDEYKLALMEADDLLDDVLERTGHKGENIREKLKDLDSGTLSNIDQVREAHEVRNNVVHDPDYKLTLDIAKRALEIYEKALRELEAF